MTGRVERFRAWTGSSPRRSALVAGAFFGVMMTPFYVLRVDPVYGPVGGLLAGTSFGLFIAYRHRRDARRNQDA
jgi:hypothetical protein